MRVDLMTDVLDRALVDLSDQLLPELTPRDGNFEPVAAGALGQLTKLSPKKTNMPDPSGDLPAYEQPAVALFYCQWYQAQQVNIAYSIFRAAIESCGTSVWPGDNQNLHIVDFGCGAYAVSLGLAFAMAELIDTGATIPPVTVTAIDHPSMLNVGERLWQNVQMRARQNGALRNFRVALDAIKHQQIVKSGFSPASVQVSRETGDRVWLTGFHVAYERGLNRSADDLRLLATATQPDVGILTAPSRKSLLMIEISPFLEPGFQQRKLDARLLLGGNLPNITTWRRALRGQSPQGYATHGGLLMGDVTWTGEEQRKQPTFSLYLRKRRE